MMQKLILTLKVFLGSLLMVGVFAGSATATSFDPLAGSCFDENGDIIDDLSNNPICVEAANQGGDDNPIVGEDSIIIRVTNVLGAVTAVIAVLIIVIAGITMILSGGDSGRIQSSRNAIIYAAVGLVIIALARSIVVFVVNRV